MLLALNSTEEICNLFANMGNLFPASFKEQLQDARDALEDCDEPANPSLCATPEQLEAFKEAREELLDGRATPEQIQKLIDQAIDAAKQDLEDLSDVANNGVESYLEDNLPPILSEPGCDDGLLPYETEEAVATATAALNGNLEQFESRHCLRYDG